jgi:hypothetical protein
MILCQAVHSLADHERAIDGIIGLPQPQDATTSAGSSPAAAYAFKASLIGAAHRFELTEEGLSWRIGGKSGVWPYADIAAIGLSYRPVSMQSRRFRADIVHIDGGHMRILSTSWQTAALMAPQDTGYRTFITALHGRMAQAGSKAALTGGLRPHVYAAAVALLVLVGVAMAGLLVRAVATGEWSGGLFLIGFAALFAWQIGGFIRRNRPRAYTFDHLPLTLLP